MPTAMGDGNEERLNEIKAVLRALLISNGKQDVSTMRLNGMFREEEGDNIPYKKYGYTSLQEFLRSMPDVLTLRYNRQRELCVYHVECEESAHISSLVARQKSKPSKRAKFNASYYRRPTSYGSSHNNYYRPPSQTNTMSTQKALRQVLEELRSAPKYFQKHNGIRKSDILQKFKDKPGRNSITSLHTLNAKLKELSQYLVVDDDWVYFKEDVFKVDSDYPQKQSFQNLEVRSAPVTIPAPAYQQATHQSNGYRPVVAPQPPQQASYQQAPYQQPAPSQTNQSQRSLPSQTDQSQQRRSNDVVQTRKTSENSCDGEILKERIKFRLQKLIEKFPEGIWASELPSLYFREYDIKLDYEDLGFSNITEFVSAIPDIFTIADIDDTGRHMILDARIPLNKPKSKQQTQSLASHYNFDDYLPNQKEPVPSKLSSTVCQKFIPEGMMGFDETVENIRVELLAAEDYFEVNISEIFTPTFFWITLRQNKQKIKKMMAELGEFYKQQDLDECRLAQALVETGLNVACIYADMWHRAIIKKVNPDGFAVVLFYDYGTVKTYNPNDLYYLHKKFSALPAQALACGLYNVKAPEGNEWSNYSINKFVNKVWNVPLIATVCETNENNNTMMITLTDTNDESADLHLNDWMVENGLAVRGKMENIPSSKYHTVTYGVPLDKICMYDEDILRKREREYERSLKLKEQYGALNGKEYTQDHQAEIKDIDSASNYMTDSSFDASSIATLVRENIDLTKQTNTITQAILSNLPIGASKTFEMPTSAKSNACSEDIKKISSDLNRNLTAIKSSFSEMSNDSCKSGVYSSQINRNFNDGSSVVSSSSLQSSSLGYVQSTKAYPPTEPSDHRASNQSLYSRPSTTDLQSRPPTTDFQSRPPTSTQENNFRNQTNGYHREFDNLSSKDGTVDGTPTFYLDEPPKKNQINIEYPSNFAKTMVEKSTVINNNNATSMNNNVLRRPSFMKESDEGYQTPTAKFVSSAPTSMTSSNASIKVSSAPFTAIQLSDGCSRKTIHIFHLDNEGWISVDEFIDCFTNLKLGRIMFKLLETFNVNVSYKHVTRVDNPQLFSELDQSKIKAQRENGRIHTNYVLILMPMKAMLHVLAKLDFVDPKVFKEAAILMKQHKENAETVLFERFGNNILYDALNLLIEYREFRRLYMSQRAN